jgi:pyruvoyl-dependent arginine decarboxylase (PvlArgDC)
VADALITDIAAASLERMAGDAVIGPMNVIPGSSVTPRTAEMCVHTLLLPVKAADPC